MADRQQLHNLIDQLPDSEVVAASRFLEFLTAREAPINAELLARIDQTRATDRSFRPESVGRNER